MASGVGYLRFHLRFLSQRKTVCLNFQVSMFPFTVTIIFYLFGLWHIKTHPFVSASHRQKINQPLLTTTTATMDCFLNILKEPQPKPEENTDEEKLRRIASKISIWDFYGILQANYLAFSKEEKMRMSKEFYNKSVSKFYAIGEPTLFFCLNCLTSFLLFLTVCSLKFSRVIFCLANEGRSMQIDGGISQAVKGTDKILMVKNIFGNDRIEITLEAKKTTS